MRIEHLKLLNEFISFWFETRVDGKLKYETLLDFQACEWSTRKSDGDLVLLKGTWSKGLPEGEVL